jgi:hypothetical protein
MNFAHRRVSSNKVLRAWIQDSIRAEALSVSPRCQMHQISRLDRLLRERARRAGLSDDAADALASEITGPIFTDFNRNAGALALIRGKR